MPLAIPGIGILKKLEAQIIAAKKATIAERRIDLFIFDCKPLYLKI